MGLISGAFVGLLVAVGTGKSKAQYAALGAAIGYGAKVLYNMTPAGQQAARDAQARSDAFWARRNTLQGGRGGV